VGPGTSLDDMEKRKILPLPELDPSAVQPVASRYIDCDIPAPLRMKIAIIIVMMVIREYNNHNP
jgi:hypothetical protein